MLAPGKKKTHRAYVWAYSTTPFSALKAVVYDFSPSRAGEHARNFLGAWSGKLVCDDFAGYKAGFERGMTEIGCMAHARRKFFDLHIANKSQLAEQALHSIGGLYEVERQARDMSVEDRWRIRQEKRRRWRKYCMAGCWPSEIGYLKDRQLAKPWITALNAG